MSDLLEPAGKRWTPILDGSEGQAVDAITSIATALSDRDLVSIFGRGLSRGSAGVALFFLYLFRFQPENRWRQEMMAWLTHAVTPSAAPLYDLALFAGRTGLAWTVEHVAPDPVQTNADPRQIVDSLLFQHLDRRPWQGSFDLVFGLVGYGVYGLERRHHPDGSRLLEAVIERLCELAMPTSEGVTWWTRPELLPASVRATRPTGWFDLGVAHGVPGVIALLSQACAIGAASSKVRSTLIQAVEWLLAQRNPNDGEICFGETLNTPRRAAEPTRSKVAWCYGDLGVSAALYLAGVNTGEQIWVTNALEIARRAARRPMARTGVRDAGFCHGAAGNGHIFNRLYQATGEQTFLDAARRWFAHTLEFYRPGTGIGGFQVWWGDSEGIGQWRYMPGLLRGSAGIGLALLAAIGTVDPGWDRIFLIDIPPRVSWRPPVG